VDRLETGLEKSASRVAHLINLSGGLSSALEESCKNQVLGKSMTNNVQFKDSSQKKTRVHVVGSCKLTG
jgi:hypothetical protein